MCWRPFIHRTILWVVGRLVQWTSQATILDFATPMHGPSHVTAECIATKDPFFSSHYEDHLCPNGFPFDLIHLEFR